MKKFWRELWKNEREFFGPGQSTFRHGVRFIPVSTIAAQFYCEMKVDHEYRLGEVPTEAKEDGTAAHNELIPSEAVAPEKFAELVDKKRPTHGTLLVWGSAGALRLVGEPDHIIWTSGKPVWLVELKTTRRDPSALWSDQLNQVIVYALLLEKMGFDCARMQLALVRLRVGALSRDEKATWIDTISRHLENGTTDDLESEYAGSMKVHIIRYDRAAAERIVLLKQGYWLGQRDPIPSTSVGKCRACEYNSACSSSLYDSKDNSSTRYLSQGMP